MARGPKVARRDLREDKVYITMAGVVDYVIRYRLWIILGALAIVILFAIGYFFTLRSRSVAVEASWALYQTTFLEQASERIAALEKVADDYGKTPAGRFASFELANALYQEGSYEKAIEAFQKFLKENPNHLLAPSSIEAIGFCQESLGQWKEAIDTYKGLIRKRPENPEAARASYRIGYCHENSGDTANAIEAYENTAELLPNSLWAEYANERLNALRPASVSPPETALNEEPADEAAPVPAE